MFVTISEEFLDIVVVRNENSQYKKTNIPIAIE